MCMIITPEQIRAARALLRLEQDELARRAQVSVATVRRLEAAEGAGRIPPDAPDAWWFELFPVPLHDVQQRVGKVSPAGWDV